MRKQGWEVNWAAACCQELLVKAFCLTEGVKNTPMDIVLKPFVNLPQKYFKPKIGSVTCNILFALYLGWSITKRDSE